MLFWLVIDVSLQSFWNYVRTASFVFFLWPFPLQKFPTSRHSLLICQVIASGFLRIPYCMTTHAQTRDLAGTSEVSWPDRVMSWGIFDIKLSRHVIRQLAPILCSHWSSMPPLPCCGSFNMSKVTAQGWTEVGWTIWTILKSSQVIVIGLRYVRYENIFFIYWISCFIIDLIVNLQLLVFHEEIISFKRRTSHFWLVLATRKTSKKIFCIYLILVLQDVKYNLHYSCLTKKKFIMK